MNHPFKWIWMTLYIQWQFIKAFFKPAICTLLICLQETLEHNIVMAYRPLIRHDVLSSSNTQQEVLSQTKDQVLRNDRVIGDKVRCMVLRLCDVKKRNQASTYKNYSAAGCSANFVLRFRWSSRIRHSQSGTATGWNWKTLETKWNLKDFRNKMRFCRLINRPKSTSSRQMIRWQQQCRHFAQTRIWSWCKFIQTEQELDDLTDPASIENITTRHFYQSYRQGTGSCLFEHLQAWHQRWNQD